MIVIKLSEFMYQKGLSQVTKCWNKVQNMMLQKIFLILNTVVDLFIAFICTRNITISRFDVLTYILKFERT